MEIVKTRRLMHDLNLCTGCGICEIMCSLYHEGLLGPALARSHIIRRPFTARHSHDVCQQCPSPDCYFACPMRDKAICIDETTGVTYINEGECTGCGLCVEACPFDPPRIKINTEKNTAFKCDLCRGREGGPVCIEYCPFQALSLLSQSVRG